MFVVLGLVRIKTEKRTEKVMDNDPITRGLTLPAQVKIETHVAHLTKRGFRVSQWIATHANVQRSTNTGA